MTARDGGDSEEYSIKVFISSMERDTLWLLSKKERRPAKQIAHDALIQYLKDRSEPSQIGGAVVNEGDVTVSP